MVMKRKALGLEPVGAIDATTGRVARAGVLSLLVAVCVMLASPGMAQTQSVPLLLVNPEQVLARSETGRALVQSIETERAQLIQRATEIARAFETEERALSDLRPTLDRAEFDARAEAFDTRVRAAREQQDREASALARMADQRQRAFFIELSNIYAALLQETGAQAVLDIRTVLLADQSLDVTDLVIERLDQR